MTQTDTSIKGRILAAMPNASFNEPATEDLIEEAEFSLAVTFLFGSGKSISRAMVSLVQRKYDTCIRFWAATVLWSLRCFCEMNGNCRG